MLSDFKYLTAALARKEFIPELTHFHIHDHSAWAFDGVMSMHTHVDVDMTVRPHAAPFVKAIAACSEEGTIQMGMTNGGRLSIHSGRFRAFVECLDVMREGLPIPKPQGDSVKITEALFDSIKELAPFMSIDASRPWAQGLRIVGNSTYATNNIILVERWHGSEFPYEIIIPSDFVKAVLKINEMPIDAQVTNTSLTFHFENERWIRTQLVIGDWPGNLGQIFKNSPGSSLPDEFFPALDQLRPFMDDRGRLWIYPDRITTSKIDGEGASVAMETNADGALFHLDQLKLLQPVMTRIDLTTYPSPSPWFGDNNNIRGIIVGQREI